MYSAEKIRSSRGTLADWELSVLRTAIKKVGPQRHVLGMRMWIASSGERQKIKEHLSREFELDWKSLGISVLSVLKSFQKMK